MMGWFKRNQKKVETIKEVSDSVAYISDETSKAIANNAMMVTHRSVSCHRQSQERSPTYRPTCGKKLDSS